jgi:hypothetical protein
VVKASALHAEDPRFEPWIGHFLPAGWRSGSPYGKLCLRLDILEASDHSDKMGTCLTEQSREYQVNASNCITVRQSDACSDRRFCQLRYTAANLGISAD